MGVTYTGTIQQPYTWGQASQMSVNVSTDTFIMLLLSSSWTPSQENDDLLADIVAHEISGSGYARQTLTGVSWSRSGSVSTFTFSPVTFTASGGSITARRWAIFDDTVTAITDPVVAWGLLRSDGNDLVIPSGQSAIVRPLAAGLYSTTVP